MENHLESAPIPTIVPASEKKIWRRPICSVVRLQSAENNFRINPDTNGMFS